MVPTWSRNYGYSVTIGASAEKVPCGTETKTHCCIIMAQYIHWGDDIHVFWYPSRYPAAGNELIENRWITKLCSVCSQTTVFPLFCQYSCQFWIQIPRVELSWFVYLTSLLNSQGLMSDGPAARQWHEGWKCHRLEYARFRTRDLVIWSGVFYRST